MVIVSNRCVDDLKCTAGFEEGVYRATTARYFVIGQRLLKIRKSRGLPLWLLKAIPPPQLEAFPETHYRSRLGQISLPKHP